MPLMSRQQRQDVEAQVAGPGRKRQRQAGQGGALGLLSQKLQTGLLNRKKGRLAQAQQRKKGLSQQALGRQNVKAGMGQRMLGQMQQNTEMPQQGQQNVRAKFGKLAQSRQLQQQGGPAQQAVQQNVAAQGQLGSQQGQLQRQAMGQRRGMRQIR